MNLEVLKIVLLSCKQYNKYREENRKFYIKTFNLIHDLLHFYTIMINHKIQQINVFPVNNTKTKSHFYPH